MPIRIECRGADTLPLDAIEEFQGKMTHDLCRKRDKAIRKKHAHGLSIRKLAKLYDLSFQRIQQILAKAYAAQVE